MAGFFSKLMGRGSASSSAAAEQEAGRAPTGDPFDIDYGPGTDADSVIYQISGMLLGYPSQELFDSLPELQQIAASTGNEQFIAAVQTVADWMHSDDLENIQSSYVQEYDLSRRHSLHLSYWTDGDTRRRGMALVRFKQMYREAGMEIDLDGELPDYLPLVLEFAALVDRRAGRAALQTYRPSLELTRLAMRDDKLPHYGLMQAICDTLPGASPDTQEQVQKMAAYGPPTETVGLPGYDDPRVQQAMQAAVPKDI